MAYQFLVPKAALEQFPATVIDSETPGIGFQVTDAGETHYRVIVSAGSGDIDTINALADVVEESNNVPFPFTPNTNVLVPITNWLGDVSESAGRFSVDTAGELFEYYAYIDQFPADEFDVEAAFTCDSGQETGIGFRVDVDNWITVTLYQQASLRVRQKVSGVIYPRLMMPITYADNTELSITKTGVLWTLDYGGAAVRLASAQQAYTRLCLVSTATADSFDTVAWREV